MYFQDCFMQCQILLILIIEKRQKIKTKQKIYLFYSEKFFIILITVHNIYIYYRNFISANTAELFLAPLTHTWQSPSFDHVSHPTLVDVAGW